MQKPKSVKELLRGSGTRLAALAAKSEERLRVLKSVCDSLPPELAHTVVSAGIDRGQLTVGVARASWAARLRYATDALRKGVGEAMGVDIQRVRIKIVPPRP